MDRRLDDVGTEAFTWRDLYVIVRHLPDTSALRRSQGSGEPPWTITDYLLALLVDLTQNANWQRAGRKNAPKPKPLRRPGEKSTGQQYGSDPIPQSEFDDWWNNPERE